MEKRIITRGLIAGALAGLISFIFARIFAEPVINKAIAYESGRDAAQNALNKAAGIPTDPGGPDIFSRTVQMDIGVGVGLIAFGAAIGLFYSVAYVLLLGRVGRVQPRTLAMLVALAGFVGIYLVPYVKYPANPPAIGHPETIRDRGLLYLAMVVCSVAFLIAASWLGRHLAPRLGNWNASLLAGAAFVVAIGIVMAILPPLGHLAANVKDYGHQATETPLPLKDLKGDIVYPGFPADVLFNFRFISVANQLILWSGLGLIFAPMAERVVRPAMVPAEQKPGTSGAVPAAI